MSSMQAFRKLLAEKASEADPYLHGLEKMIEKAILPVGKMFASLGAAQSFLLPALPISNGDGSGGINPK